MQHRVLVLAHGRGPANREDWVAFCDILAREHENARGQLVISFGGAPDAAQRKSAIAMLSPGFVPPPVAVISDAPMIRGVVTVLNWLLQDSHKSFRTDDIVGVAEHLSLFHEEAIDLVGLAKELVGTLAAGS